MTVGRDAVPASVADTTTFPGGQPEPTLRGIGPASSGRRERESGAIPRWRAERRGRIRRCVSISPEPTGQTRATGAPSRRAIPLDRGRKEKGNTGEPPRPDKDRGQHSVG